MNKLIEKKVMEIARRHSEIIENKCKLTCERYEIDPENLIIEYSSNSKIKILVKAISYEMEDAFIVNDNGVRE